MSNNNSKRFAPEEASEDQNLSNLVPDGEDLEDDEIVSGQAIEGEEGEAEMEEDEEEPDSQIYEENQEGQSIQNEGITPQLLDPNGAQTHGFQVSKHDSATEKPAEEGKMDFLAIAQAAQQDTSMKNEQKEKKKKRDGKFLVHGREVIYDRRSLFLLDASYSVRKAIVWFIEWKWFDRFITTIILGNSVMLAMTDYNDRIYGPTYFSKINAELEYVDNVFTGIFIFECVSKILGMGFVVHAKSYLRDAWNWLDFFVVCVSLVNFIPNVNSGGLKALRTFRILRPLRTINAIPMMKQQIQSLLKALPGLANILTFLIFVYSIFSIFAVQSFAGNQYQYCRMTKEPTIVKDDAGNLISYDWPIVDTFSWLCKNDKDCKKLIQTFGPEDLEVYKCGASFDYGIKAGGKNKIDMTIQNEQILFDVVNFNHMGLAFLTIFQSLTMESWTTLMYNFMDSNNLYISILFFIFMVLFGAFFTMQLVLAEIIESFQKEKKIREEEARQAEIDAYQETLLAAKEAREKAQAELEAYLEEHPEEREEKTKEVEASPVKNDFNPLEEKKEVVEEVFDDSAFEDETVADRDARRRSHTNCFYRCFFLLIINPFFNCFIFMMIMLNTLSLAADDYPMSNMKEKIIAYCNQYFTWLFTVEMIFKLIGLGPSNYKKDVYNTFDCFIVCISLIDWTIGITVGDNVGPAGAVLQAFRAMRLLRIIKLARRWTALQDILGKIYKSLGELSIFCMLLLLFMYIFALLGMQFFSKRAYTDLDDVIVPSNEILERIQAGEILIPIRTSFNNIYLSLTTVFCVIFAEDWNWTMYRNVVTFGTQLHYYAIFFIIVFAFGNYVLFALFAAILLSHFEGGEEEIEEESEEEEAEGSQNAKEEAQPKKNICKRIFSRETGQKIASEFIDMFGKKLRTPAETTLQSLDLNKLEDEGFSFKQEPDENKNYETEGPLVAQMEKQQNDDLPPFTPMRGQDNKVDNIDMSRSSAQESDASKEADAGLLTTKLSRSTSVLLRHYSTDPEGDVMGQFVNMDDVNGSTFWIFGQNNACRCAAARLEKSKGFNNIILLLICISTVNLAIETPLDKPGIMKLRVLQYIDYFMTGAFTFELVLKIFVYGLLLTGPNAYLKQGWNCLDFVIVLSALFGLNPNATKSLKSLKTLRILRVLRPLKLASKNKGLKVAITALFKSLPAIGNLQLIIIFFLFLFGILHTTLFAGQFWSCSFDHVSLSYQQTNVLIKSQWDCFNYGGEWVNNDFHFDNTLRSVLTLFCLQSTEGWVDSMWSEVDTTDKYMQPIVQNKPIFIIFGIFIEILINLLFLNLFVGVVIETFNEEKEKINKNNLLSEQQKKWIQVQLMGYQALPEFKQQLTGSMVRDFFIKVAQHYLFDGFIMGCIIANTIVLMIKWYAMSNQVINVIQNINYGFMAIFTIEAIIKLIALRRNYFKETWNIFDFTVVVGSLAILVIGFLNLGNFAIQSTILRSMRIGRILRILRKFKKLQIIFNTLFEAIPSMASLGMLLLLLMFMYAIIGMSQFGYVNITDQPNADYHANFRDFLNSFLLLFRSATGEGWDSLMFDFGRSNQITFQCVSEMEYEQYEQNGFVSNKCGNTTIAYIFFISFIIFCVQVFLNLFVAVIVDSFGNQAAKAELPVQAIDVEIFQEIWREFDGDAKGYIKTVELENFIIALTNQENCELIMFRNRIKNKPAARRKYIASLDIPTFKNFRQVLFYDVLLALIKAKSKYVYEQDYYHTKRLRESKVRELKKKSLMTDEQINKIANKEHSIEFDGDFEKCIESFVKLDYTIDLINEIRAKSSFVSKRYKLSKEKADENVDEETGRTTYYTTKQYVYGTFAVNVWRKSIQNLNLEKAAAYGEVINGRRKIMPITAIKKDLSVIPYADPVKQGDEKQEELGGHLTERAQQSARNDGNQVNPAIVDTDFGGEAFNARKNAK